MVLIFISYRRSDSRHAAARIHTILSHFFGRHAVFFDVQSIPEGEEFPAYLREALHQARVVLVLIGPGWLVSAEGQRRLHHPHDFVRRELEIALSRGKECQVVPLLIDGARMPSADDLPPSLWRLPTLNAVTLDADPNFAREVRHLARRLAHTYHLPLRQSAQNLIHRFIEAYERQAYREAMELLERIAKHPKKPPIFDVEANRQHLQAILRDQDYNLLLGMLQAQLPLDEVRRAYERFQAEFGDHDPQGIGARVRQRHAVQAGGAINVGVGGGRMGARLLPTITWQTVRAGLVRVSEHVYAVRDFAMSRCAVSNAEYELFVRADDGYRNPDWWDYSPQARQWRAEHPQPIPPTFKGDQLPRTNLSWYDAQAFALWLSYRLGQTVGLPSEAQWQRAALGDQAQGYPWGMNFDPRRLCYGGQPRPSRVNDYPQGDSPWGIRQLCGGVWEWCSTDVDGQHTVAHPSRGRMVRGGAYTSSAEEVHPLYRATLPPQTVRPDVGLRLILLED
ncbi:MAG: SUMF1/EgtB/PvdO family nonheme iron enzyme [Anaerolineae bacterium]|nr:SUMF1/EgtB/PvdO family nonheme iron enzyme [Anaerolineae bacterium]MDW8173537.1 SUMF1/EgtB/PvdO family nonheme iron enzyme [Anaerolineae bacterium]